MGNKIGFPNSLEIAIGMVYAATLLLLLLDCRLDRRLIKLLANWLHCFLSFFLLNSPLRCNIVAKGVPGLTALLSAST